VSDPVRDDYYDLRAQVELLATALSDLVERAETALPPSAYRTIRVEVRAAARALALVRRVQPDTNRPPDDKETRP